MFHRMCQKWVAKIIYTCGLVEKVDAKFETCSDVARSGHTVVVNPLGSTRVRNTCGKFRCPNHTNQTTAG
jgi:hypothetical protein